MTVSDSSLLKTTYFAHEQSTKSSMDFSSAKLLGIFGGQGNVEDYFNELVMAYGQNKHMLKPFVETMSEGLKALALQPEFVTIHTKGLDVLSWLENPELKPSTEYLLAAPVSLPLIGLVQLVHYYLVSLKLNLVPKQLLEKFSAFTGHSQGIISAAVVAKSLTTEDFTLNSLNGLTLLFFIGARSHSVYPQTSINPNILQDSINNQEGTPSMMVAIYNLSYEKVKQLVETTNKHLPNERQLYIGLVNGAKFIVCVGHPKSLYGLNLSLRRIKSSADLDQTRVPFSKRKLQFSNKFLPITAPFHSPYLFNAKEMILEDVKKSEFTFENKLNVPVYSTFDGHNMQEEANLLESLIDQICTLPLNWENATKTNDGNYYIVDFGPGETSGIGYITNKNKSGTGHKLVIASKSNGLNTEYLYQEDLLDILNNKAVATNQDWKQMYKPRLTKINNKLLINTKMSRLTGKPPLMVAGMTPCTVSSDVVSAVTNSGYHIELAGGGQHSEAILRESIMKIIKSISPGDGVTVNLLFLNARLWSFQFPLLVKMRQEGYPIDGICIAAGVPSLEVANDYVKQIKDSGMKHVSFKPGSVSTIYQVVQIARSNPDFPIILQWTGGRAGGHHSFEDLHQPILETYGKIRECQNIILVAGSGFGDVEDTYPYFTGTWSKKYGYPDMPFDGVLFGSRIMVSKESKASLATKQAIIDAPGVEDEDWEKSYDKEIGGIITVKSELGEPIHKIATRGVKLWSEFDRTIFSLPKEKRMDYITSKRQYIIERLNKDFQKIWFGQKSDKTPCDIEEMTYSEVIYRLYELLYVSSEERWIDVTLRNLFADFLIRTEERFIYEEKASFMGDYSLLENKPLSTINKFLEIYPESRKTLLATQDIQFFIMLCSNPAMKPVPFIPVLDENLEFWFKKDSLWQSEDLAAVPDQDVQRCCILQGPVAAKHSKILNEPVKEILDNINNGLITKLATENCQIENMEYLPSLELFSVIPNSKIGNVDVAETDVDVTYTFGKLESEFPTTEDFCGSVSGNKPSWLKACLTSNSITSNNQRIDNFIPRLFKPRKQQIVKVDLNPDKSFKSITSYTNLHGKPQIRAKLSKDIRSDTVYLVLYETLGNKIIELKLEFEYSPCTSYCLIREIVSNKNNSIKHFYAQLWGCNSSSHSAKDDSELFYDFEIKKDDVLKFCQTVGNKSEHYIDREKKGKINVPLDYSIVIAWRALTQTLFDDRIDGDLLKLVHLSNEFRSFDNDSLKSGDIVHVSSDIHSIMNTPNGKLVKVSAYIHANKTKKIEVTSSFLIRGKFDNYENTFEKSKDSTYSLLLSSIEQVAILKSKSWLNWNSCHKDMLKVGSNLLIKIKNENYYKSSVVLNSVRTRGNLMLQQSTKDFLEIATINYTAENTLGNPIIEFLRRYGKLVKEKKLFEDGGYSVIPTGEEFNTKIFVPVSNFAYSKVSLDYNPIHTNEYFAELASLPSVITHGMWTSASIKSIIEIFAAENVPSRIKMYHIDFLQMVFSNDIIHVKAIHIGMRSGRKLIKFDAYNQNEVLIAKGLCEVEQPVTAYVFTGQGSQEKGMGMDLYESSLVAKKIWDSADQHFVKNYGFSILKIVKENPQQITIHFGGKKGKEIKSNYMKMNYEITDEKGSSQTLPLFPEIHKECDHYTFVSNKGLLSSTQFTQPALTLMELASFEDMRSKGLVQNECSFAGHSLGEYAALASIGNMMPIESLVDLVFYRGMTMQTAVKRDSLGRSSYGMVAVNPARVGRGFSEDLLKHIVKSIATQSGSLIEIVNYNVENWQYVISGYLINLEILGKVLDYIKLHYEEMMKMIISGEEIKIETLLNTLINENLMSLKKDPENQYMVINRTNATVPLPGIDVPFHSSFLTSGVGPFRSYLSKRIDKSYIDVKILVKNYIPNLTALPFELTKEYIQYTYDLTNSLQLKDLLTGFDKMNMENPLEQQIVAYTLVVELLCYQFASPVRWIETQDILFKNKGIERMIEIGPSPILCGMANRTLKFKYEEYDDALTFKRLTLCYTKDHDDIYYLQRDQPTTSVVHEKQNESPVHNSQQSADHKPVEKEVINSNIDIQDEALPILDYIHIIVSQKLKRTLDQIPTSKSIKELSGGKSTIQNEILGDIGKDFNGNIVEKAEELSLENLAASIKPFYSGQLGKYTSTLVTKMISSKMPPALNYSSLKKLLSEQYSLGPLRTDAVLMLCLMDEPKERFSDEKSAKLWVVDIVKKYSTKFNVNLFTSNSAQVSASSVSIDPEVLKKMNHKQELLYQRQYSALCEYFDKADDICIGDKNSLEYLNELQAITEEMGSDFIKNIEPLFDHNKARHYNSYWNWSRQDSLLLYYEIIFGKLTTVDRDITAKCINIINRADETLLEFMKYSINKCDESKGETYKLAKEFGLELIKNVEESLYSKPVYKDVRCPLGPHTDITEDGNVLYNEVPRKNIKKLSQFVDEMRLGTVLTKNSTSLIMNNVSKLVKIIDKTKNKKTQQSHEAFNDLINNIKMCLNEDNDSFCENNKDTLPTLYIKSRYLNQYNYDSDMTNQYLNSLSDITKNGVSFYNKKVLLTGCGRNSIGSDILKGLLSGGSHVVVTTSRFTRETKDYYQDLYHAYGAKDSYLVVLPFNQGSRLDIVNLINYIYNAETGLGWDLDFVIPFAAVPENDREMNNIDSFSEFSHRLMLTNVMRLLGEIKDQKSKLNIITRPAHVILPLSPNHGIFGGDGLYSESKMGLENIMNRWYCESWKDYINVIGASIGWTRSTGLMQQNNIVSEKIESYGVRTFSTQEMAFCIMGLLHPSMIQLSQKEPVWANLGGGFESLKDFKNIVTDIRKEIMESSSIKRAINQEKKLDMNITNPENNANIIKSILKSTPRAKFNFEFPKLENHEYYMNKTKNMLSGMLDLESVVVVTGFSEVGPYGNSRTRWEIEKDGHFSIEGCIEMAWMMGFIKHFNGMMQNGKKYCGWIDTVTKSPVNDLDIKRIYEDKIMKHTGIRLIEPSLFEGYDPNDKNILREILITNDMDPLEVSKEEAIHFKNKHKHNVLIYEKDEVWYVKFLKGCSIYVPKALQFSRLVAGQIPTGWDAARYGIPQDIIEQVDKITLYVLVSTVEALISSGITDPYEFYKYIHISQIGNTIGSGMGGMRSLKQMYKDRFIDKPVQKDILQETFINTMPAWINLLILSGCGPIKTPVGACATAVESVEIGVDTIMSKKASVCLVGGYDDFHEDGSNEFANMNATSNSLEEFKKGREPNEMSRPTTSSRAGFMESQGVGIQVLMNAKLALEMGVPIYAIVALTNTAMDKEGRSVPAPGQGILNTAKQINTGNKVVDVTDIYYRRSQIEKRRINIKQQIEQDYEELNTKLQSLKQQGYFENIKEEQLYLESSKRYIDHQAMKEESMVLNLWGNQFYVNDPFIAPIKGALAVYGLTIDDIGIASFHGTGTKANDTNETEVVNKQFKHLNRAKGNACPAVFQKYLTGHPKGAAAAWMFNGVIQSLNSGVIPGNRNADNIDEKLRNFEYVVFPSKTIQTDGIKAGLLKSFGFGQVGGEILVIHRDYLFGAITRDQFEKYSVLNNKRYQASYRYSHDYITNTNDLVRVKSSPPFKKHEESNVYLDPLARAKLNRSKEYEITSVNASQILNTADNFSLFENINMLKSQKGVGIDVELISSMNMDNNNFLENNFTKREIEYCMSRPDPQSSFCGKWAAKEAFIKAVSSFNTTIGNQWTKGSAAPLKEIEIIAGNSNAPIVNLLSTELKEIAKNVGVKDFKISISHSGNYAVAICITL